MNHYDLSSEKRASEALFWQNKMGNPQKSLRLVAVTGTNGKTSVSTLLADILRKNGEKTGLIGTVSCSDGVTATASDYTTPPPAILYPLLAEMVKNGVTTVIMEASSHALSQERLFGLPFDLAIFTNLTRDHLDYHGTRDAYLAAKAKSAFPSLPEDGKPYEFSGRILKATLMTNIVYPVWRRDGWVKHFCPGKSQLSASQEQE